MDSCESNNNCCGQRRECTGRASSVDAVGLDIVGNAPDMPRPSMLYARNPKQLFCHRLVHECLMDHFFDVVKMRTITRSPTFARRTALSDTTARLKQASFSLENKFCLFCSVPTPKVEYIALGSTQAPATLSGQQNYNLAMSASKSVS